MKIIVRTIFLISIVSFIFSCKEKESLSSSKEKALVKVNLVGEALDEKLIKIKSQNNTRASSQNEQIQTIRFDENYSITVTLSSENTKPKEKLANKSKNAALKIEELKKGILYKVIVYDDNGTYIAEKNFTYGINDNEGFQLESNKSYTFVAYSVNSSTNIPILDTTEGNSLDKAKLSKVSEDLMSFKKTMTVVSGTNNLEVILKHRFSMITTKLDASGISNITNIDAEIIPTNTSADFFFANNNLKYNGLATKGATVNFPTSELNKQISISNQTLLISDTIKNGELKINSLTIAGITRNDIKIKDLHITPGVKYDLNITLNATLKTIKILAVGYDGWNTLLYDNSNGTYTRVARSKLNNPKNFGPSGTVRIKNFSYSFINVNSSTTADFEAAINNADIIWIGYVSNSDFSDGKRAMLSKKINEKKKFFFVANDNYNGTFFPGRSKLVGYTFDYVDYSTNKLSVISGVGPTKGIFGNLSSSQTITETLATGKITGYPSDAVPFLKNPDGSINGMAQDNFVTIGGTNWYINYSSTDGFYNGNNGCSTNPNSIMFCNIFEKAVNYVKNNP